MEATTVPDNEELAIFNRINDMRRGPGAGRAGAARPGGKICRAPRPPAVSFCRPAGVAGPAGLG